MQLNKFRQTLANWNVSLKLNMCLFDATVSPTSLFGLPALPLTQTQLLKLDTLQRRMLRLMEHEVNYGSNKWGATGRVAGPSR